MRYVTPCFTAANSRKHLRPLKLKKRLKANIISQNWYQFTDLERMKPQSATSK